MPFSPYQKKQIIIVDSASPQVEELTRLLQENQFEVFHFENAKEALQFCRSKLPSLVVLELALPGIHGLDLYRKLKNDFMTRDIPIVVTTRELELDERLKTLELEIDDYISKPYHPEEVAARIDTIVQEVEVIEQIRQSTSHGFAGNLSEMNLVDLIQTLELGKKSGIVHLLRENKEGYVFFKEGQLIDAYLDGLEPQKALDTLLTWLDGTFQVSLHPVERIRTIEQSSREILIRGNQLIQEWRELTKQMPPLHSIFIVAGRPNGDDMADAEKKLLTQFLEPKSILQGIETSELDSISALRAIKNFIESGKLVKKNSTDFHNSLTRSLSEQMEAERLKNKNIYSRIISFFKRKNNKSLTASTPSNFDVCEENQSSKNMPVEQRRQSHKIYLSKSDLLLIRQKLSSSLT